MHFEKLDHDLASASSPFGILSVPGRRGIYRNFVKRVLDTVIIVLMAPVVVPVVVALAAVVARDGHMPFYASRRVGRNGRVFNMLKLRTMVPDAEALLAGHLEADAEARREWESTQKLKNDPRITRLGRFLRKFSLDELPQLYNVLNGDMSLVGPRPMLPSQRALYPGLSYYSLRPGITGPWQVSDRNDCEFAKRADHDREYEQRMSFLVDAALLSRTVGVIVRGTGY
ncbi:MAG: sugar transferase [Paracoccaceae bacterium]